MAEDGRGARDDEEPAVQQINLNQLQFEAMIAEITRRLQGANQANINFPVVDHGAGRGAGRAGLRARRGMRVEVEEEQLESADESEAESQEGQYPRHNNRRVQAEDNLGSLKLRIPPFHGKNDPDAYLEWEKKIELVFGCQQYTEERKVKLAATEFCGYAINWWEQITTTRRRNGEPQIASWFEMKTVMKKRFVPVHYGRDLHQRLRRLTQGARSVEDYHQELETLMMKAGVQEDAEATMARFQGGLNREIQDRLELQEYEDMDELLHKAILIEQQHKRKGGNRTQFGSASKPSYSRDDKPMDKPKETTTREDKGKGPATFPRTRNIKCFKCQGFGHYANECTNKKVMILLDNGEVVSEDEDQGDEPGEEDVDYPVQGELLVTRRTLNVLPKTREHEQRENLFHTRCVVQDKVCSVIIDGGSCTNVASETLVSKLGLPVQNHPKPYPLQWLNEEGEMRVTKQVKVPLTIGRYQDEITCDVLPMDAGHILLGRPWQYDKKAIHDGFTNRHSFTHKDKRIILVPLTPQEVHQDQLQLKLRREEAKAAAKDSPMEDLPGKITTPSL